ncbi:hypothetical protein [Herbiconiux ginsengi]|uniref:Colicin import membrane protein n=1 Tax=Herbiconiux ginsengi TaxID=381665 RepID=A0A1H3TFZ0_9MICO|nr:hypothetical protein [Herbiconiux ginsengi]SDZ48259.1 hypothetical protein SAMN05216554_4105 [Herbiconiux ginsengi]
MAEDSDGMGEALDGQLRTALAVALQLAQRFARLREELARVTQSHTEQQTLELQARFDAERSAAAASLTLVQQAEWWNHTSVGEISAAYETAEAWRPVDPGIARTADQMGDELRVRYDIDVAELGADSIRVRALLERTERDRADAAAQRGESRKDDAEGIALLAAAEQVELDVEQSDHELRDAQVDAPTQGLAREQVSTAAATNRNSSAHAYDSAQSRRHAAARLEESGLDPELIRVRIISDRDNALPATAAVDSAPGKQTRARTVSNGSRMQRERGGLSR